jgi:hypothetical protein
MASGMAAPWALLGRFNAGKFSPLAFLWAGLVAGRSSRPKERSRQGDGFGVGMVWRGETEGISVFIG